MTPSHAFTVSLTDFPGRSTTPPPRRSSPLPQTTRISSTTPVRRRPPPSSPGTDRAHGRGERTAMVIEACRAVLTERFRLMCKQRGRQQQADRWSWLLVAALTQLRLARGIVEDLRLPWERPRDPAQLTPARVRRGFRRLRAVIGTPASPPKSTTPGPGRPKGTRKPPRTRYPAVKKAA